MTTMHGGTSHTGLVAVSEARACGVMTGGSDLSVTGGVSLAVSLPEWSLAGSLGVVVGWGWAKALFLLVVTCQHELDDSADEEEEDGTNGNSKACCVQAAGIAEITSAGCFFGGKTITDGGVDKASAATGSMAGEISDSGEAASEADVEEDCSEGEYAYTTEA